MLDTTRIDHRDFVKSLTPAQRAELTRKSDFAGAVHLAGHWGLILLLGGLIAAGVPGWPILLLPQGILIIFLFTLLHETSHRTVFAHPAVNRVVAGVCGLLILIPPEWFRQYHFAHHRHTQDPERDPELQEAKPETTREYVLHVSGLPVWRSQLVTLVKNALGRCDDSFVPGAKSGRVRMEARVMIGVYALLLAASVATGSAVLAYTWLLPLLFGQPFLRLYLLAEHGRCPFVTNMFENTRTTFTNRLVLKLAWNMPYHTEHHVLPAVPFHQLPRFHELTRSRLHEIENGYSRFHRRYFADLE